MAIQKFTKQPVDLQDYDVDFSAYLELHNDTIQSVVVEAELGLTVESFTHALGVVKAWLSGGLDGESYKASATVTTFGGRVKQHDFSIRVREL